VMVEGLWYQGGKIWRVARGEGVEAVVPVTDRWLESVQVEGEEGEPRLVKLSEELIPPPREVGTWLRFLRPTAQRMGVEVGGYVLRRKKKGEEGGWEWTMYCPPQECSAAGWSVTEVDQKVHLPLALRIDGGGWQRIGTMHLHPGGARHGAPEPSGIDEREWEDNPGVYLIGWTQEGSHVSVSVAVIGHVFPFVVGIRAIMGGDGVVWTEGGKPLGELVRKRTYSSSYLCSTAWEWSKGGTGRSAEENWRTGYDRVFGYGYGYEDYGKEDIGGGVQGDVGSYSYVPASLDEAILDAEASVSEALDWAEVAGTEREQKKIKRALRLIQEVEAARMERGE